ncbi:MAG TPA: leucyl aminopeptidase [Aestuariivirgaceae bacterium]|jgi:leucyl aminopeptidase
MNPRWAIREASLRFCHKAGKSALPHSIGLLMKIKFSPVSLPRSGPLVLFAATGGKLSGLAAKVNEKSDGYVANAIKAAKFEANREQTMDLLVPSNGQLRRMVVAGLGDPAKLQPRDLEYVGGTVCGALQSGKITDAVILADFSGLNAISDGEAAALVAAGMRLRQYQFSRYKSPKSDDKTAVKAATVLTSDTASAQRLYHKFEAVAEGVHLARDLVNEPANVLTPAEFAKRVGEVSKLGVKVDVLRPKDMKKLGMGALLGVAQGSTNEPRLVVMQWMGGNRSERPIAFVGKGVTFDTGGISMKPASGMEDMKGDMGGAACVSGLLRALAARKAKVNAVGIIGLVENMPSGAAQRPGDVVRSMSGKTIAVLNTDAEGRLILADALWYAQKRFKPKVIIDLATLTGAILIALGKEHAGLFSNNDELAGRISQAGVDTGERVWRMPLAAEYDRLIDSDIADVKNIGGRNAGAITAAQFLQRFVNDTPWAHLDVAGTAMDSNRTPINQSWGSGWGVRLLNKLVADHYET